MENIKARELQRPLGDGSRPSWSLLRAYSWRLHGTVIKSSQSVRGREHSLNNGRPPQSHEGAAENPSYQLYLVLD